MYCCYFDENKISPDNPNFWIGGICIPEEKIIMFEKLLRVVHNKVFQEKLLEKNTEFHGYEIFHGKNSFKGMDLKTRINIFREVFQFIQIAEISIILNCKQEIHGKSSSSKVYQLGLKNAISQVNTFLIEKNEAGVLFCDIEQAEMNKAIRNHVQDKTLGIWTQKNEKIVDTIYFIESHSSRFMQVADMIVFIANRYQGKDFSSEKWHEKEMYSLWNTLKENSSVNIKY